MKKIFIFFIASIVFSSFFNYSASAAQQEVQPSYIGLTQQVPDSTLHTYLNETNKYTGTFPVTIDSRYFNDYLKKNLFFFIDEAVPIESFQITTGSVAEYQITLFDAQNNKTVLKGSGTKSFLIPSNITHVSISSIATVKIDSLKFYNNLSVSELPVTDLTETHGSNDVTLKWKNPVSDELEAIIIKKDGVIITELAKTAEIYTNNSLASDLTYSFQVIAKYTGDRFSAPKSISFKTEPLPEDLTPPGEVSMVASENTHNTVTLTWKNPLDTDFLEVRIYRNGELIIDHLKGTKFVDTNLVPNTTYTYKIVAVDTSQNNSSGYLQTIKTDIEKDLTPPAPPTNVVTTAGNASLSVKWKANAESDLKGYNVYVNGVKHNDVVIFANSYVVPSLTNGITYNITVTAVDTSENESLPSGQSSVAPDQSAMPIMQAKYNLKDVSDGTSNWFTTLWPILAFAVGIPLAFYISNRIKTLFFA